MPVLTRYPRTLLRARDTAPPPCNLLPSVRVAQMNSNADAAQRNCPLQLPDIARYSAAEIGKQLMDSFKACIDCLLHPRRIFRDIDKNDILAIASKRDLARFDFFIASVSSG